MRYVDQALGSELFPKLLGCYEKELHPWMDRLLQGNYRYLLDVGCAEGYYVVGFARRRLDLEVYAFDLNPRSCELVSELARKNGVEQRVHWGGVFSQETLKQIEEPERTLLICDIEGDEVSLISPGSVPGIERLDMLIEVHDANDGSIESILRERFEETHLVEKVVAQTRTTDDCLPAAGIFLSRKSKLQLVNERRRYGLSWLLLTRKPPQERSTDS